MRRWSRGWLLVAAVPALFVGYFFVYPVARILVLGLAELDLGTAAVEARLLRVGWFTVWQATVSTGLTLLLAAPITWAVSTFDFRGRRLATALVTVPFVLPTVVVGAAFVSMGWRESVGAILAAHVFFNLAVVVRTVGTLWSRIDPDLTDSARVLGAGSWQAWRTVTLPLLRPSIAAAAAIVFLFTFTSFGTVLILGGFRYATLEVEIYRQAVTLFDLPLAAALAVAQLVGVSAALYAYSRYQQRHTSSWALRSEARRPEPKGANAVMVAVAVGGTLLALAVPLFSLAARSGPYPALLRPDPVAGTPIAAVGNSLVFAVTAMVLATVIGLLAAAVVARGPEGPGRWFDLVLMLPLGTSAVTVGFGFIIALDWPIDLRATAWLVPVAHGLVAVPFVVRTLVPTLRAIPEEMREAASVLGAAPRRVWRTIDLPIASRAMLVGSGFAFVVSLGEFGATSFVARPNTVTMPVMIYRLLTRPGELSFGMAMAMAVVLAVLTAAVVLWIDRLRVGEIGRF